MERETSNPDENSNKVPVRIRAMATVGKWSSQLVCCPLLTHRGTLLGEGSMCGSVCVLSCVLCSTVDVGAVLVGVLLVTIHVLCGESGWAGFLEVGGLTSGSSQ